VAGRVDQVQRVLVPVARPVEQAHRVRLDRDAALALEVHRVEHLVDRLLGVHRAGERQEPIRKCRFTVVDVGDDGEIADATEDHRLSLTRCVAAPEVARPG
jgi:hypothetical protein